MKNRKSKVLKAMVFSSLTLVMGAIGTLAFAPLQSTQISSASEAEMTTEQGLITPKADDPVIYTTESGLDIKWGNALPSTFNPSLNSGNLQGFPYFTTTSDSTTYTWVIIGRNANTSLFGKAVSSYLFSAWKTAHNSDMGAKFNTDGYYFFNNVYENSTPAGSAINSTVPSKSYVSDLGQDTFLKTNSEIPSGCVLVLANDCVATGAFNVDNNTDGNNNNDYVARYRNGETIVKAMQGYYTNTSFGLSSISSSIQVISTLKTYGYSYYDAGGTGWYTTNLTNQYIYPLASHSSSNFYWKNYLTETQMKLSTKQWIRCLSVAKVEEVKIDTSHYYGSCDYIDANGVQQTSGEYTNSVLGYRPAFCLKI